MEKQLSKMPKIKDKTKTQIIIIIESDVSKHGFWEHYFNNIKALYPQKNGTEGGVYFEIFSTVEEAIAKLQNEQILTDFFYVAPPQYCLAKREHEVMVLLSKGHLYKEIAQILNISLGSLKQYVHRIYRKLEVVNRTEALNKYFKNQIS